MLRLANMLKTSIYTQEAYRAPYHKPYHTDYQVHLRGFHLLILDENLNMGLSL